MARDRRRQEDQMWAMQDYIQQYQQLVCQFRSENAALRRQLNDDRSGLAVEREPQLSPGAPVGPPATNGVPKFQDSPRPGIDDNQTPAPNIETPDVPPLGQGTSIDTRNQYETLEEYESGQADSFHDAQLASYDAASTSDSPDILLTGEVVANESGGGPRLVIDIESFDQSGRIARFDGNVSLAILSSEGDFQRRLARWDYGPDDVRSAVDATSNEPTMRFQVELPAGTRVDGPMELWAKLAPTSGAKLFSHARLDLANPGAFSSRTDKIWASEESVVAASYVETPTQPGDTAAVVNESEWSTAMPGKPAILPPESDEATGGWKAATGPLPAVVETTNPPISKRASSRLERPMQTDSKPANGTPVEISQKPSWTPERPRTQSHLARPSWSATR